MVKGTGLTIHQLLFCQWLAESRINKSEWLGKDGKGGYRLSGPDGSITIPLEDQIALRPFFEPNPDMVPGRDCRMYRLTDLGRAALAERGGAE